MIQPQRDPAIYRARMAAKKREAFEASKKAVLDAKAALIAQKVEIRKCYEEHTPTQVSHAREMMSCLGVSVIHPKVVRGTACKTIYSSASEAFEIGDMSALDDFLMQA